MTIYDIISRAEALARENKLASVTPERVGNLIGDTLKYINSYQLLASSPLMHKTYASVSAMQADASPVSDLTGNVLKKGQLVVIVPADQSDATAGDVYRYDGPSGNTSAWTFIAKIGGVPADAELNATSTNPVQNQAVTAKLTELNLETCGEDIIGKENSTSYFYKGISILSKNFYAVKNNGTNSCTVLLKKEGEQIALITLQAGEIKMFNGYDADEVGGYANVASTLNINVVKVKMQITNDYATYDLNGSTLELSSDVVLDFNKSRFVNGTIIGNNTKVINQKDDTFNDVIVSNIICEGVVTLKENNFDNILSIKADAYRIRDTFRNTHKITITEDAELIFTEDSKITIAYDGEDNIMWWDESDGGWKQKIDTIFELEGDASNPNRISLNIKNLYIESPFADDTSYYNNVFSLFTVRYVNLKLLSSKINGATWLGFSAYNCGDILISNCRFEWSWTCCYIKDCSSTIFTQNYISNHFSQSNECKNNKEWISQRPTFRSRFFDGLGIYGSNVSIIGNVFEDMGQSCIYTSKLKNASIVGNIIRTATNYCVDFGTSDFSSDTVDLIENIVVSANIMYNSRGFISLNRASHIIISNNIMRIGPNMIGHATDMNAFGISHANDIEIYNNHVYLAKFIRLRDNAEVIPYYIRCGNLSQYNLKNMRISNYVNGEYEFGYKLEHLTKDESNIVFNGGIIEEIKRIQS